MWAFALLFACTGEVEPGETGTPSETAEPGWPAVSVDPEAWPPELLSDTNLLTWDGATLTYNEGVAPYGLNTALFSDFALKERAVFLPEGTAAAFTEAGVLDFPVGTVITKSFLFPADLRVPEDELRLIETRLLILGSEGWQAWPYLWREDGSEAVRHVSGAVMEIDFVDGEGEARMANYLVPQRNQCAECHEVYDELGERVLLPIGPTARNLNGPSQHGDGSPNQLEHMAQAGRLTGLPEVKTVDAATLWSTVVATGVAGLSGAQVEAGARDYLDINCAHCHSPTGIEGVTSQFFMNHDNVDPYNLGICKRPGSAGPGGKNRDFDIVPGDPEQSILWYRLDTETVGAMMPQIGRSLSHGLGSELVWRWIGEMEPESCE